MPSVRENAPCSAVSISLREKVRPARREVGVSETKFALHAQNMRKSGISSELGEFCTEYEVSRFLLGEFSHGTVAGRAVLGQIFRADWHCAQVSEATRRPPCRHWWGIAPREAVMHRVAGVSNPRVVQFPAAQCRIRLCARGVPLCAAGSPYLRCNAHRTRA